MTSSRWPWLTVLACVAASGNAVAQGAPAQAPPPEAPPAESEQPPAREWRLPPLRTAGTLSYQTRLTRATGEPSAAEHLVTGTITGTTYIYRPWIATVGGSLGLTQTWESSGTGDGAEPHRRMRSSAQFVTGNARLDWLPRSRFPGEFHWSRQDSRADSGLASPVSYWRQNIGLSQRYRPEDNATSLYGVYNHHVQEGLGTHATQDALTAEFSRRWRFSDVGVTATHSRARSDDHFDDSRYTTLVGRHSYTPNTRLSVESTGNVTHSQERGLFSSDVTVLQLSSVGLYRAETRPLTLTGTARGLVLREAGGGDLDSVGATAGMSYDITPSLRVSGTGSAATTRSSGGTSNALSGAAAVNYQGDSHEFAGIRHEWFAGASVNGGMTSGDLFGRQTDDGVQLQVGHSASRSWSFGPQSTLGASASQSLSASRATSSHSDGTETRLDTRLLLHNLSLTWQRAGAVGDGYARASYSDSAELGGGHTRFQLLNFQLSGKFDLGYGRSVQGDLTWQRTMQRASDLPTSAFDAASLGRRTSNRGASGEVSFYQARLFDVPRLRFQSRLKLARDVLRQPGLLDSIPDHETRLWENRLDWSIGRLETQLQLRLSEVDGRRVQSLWFRVQRSFGN